MSVEAALAAVASALRAEGVAMTALADGTGVIVNLRGSELLTLNETALVLALAMREGECRTPRDARELLCRRFDVELEAAERDAVAFLGRLAAALGESPVPR